MRRFADKKTELIYLTRFAQGVRQNVSIEAHKAMRLLVASSSHQDVSVIGPIFRWRKELGLFGLHIGGKWFVTFRWSDDFGAHGIILERRQALE
jgi:plasmid maintenance system killer protein